MSVEKYDERLRAIDNSVASARIEGMEATAQDIELMKRVASGELTTEQAVEIALGTRDSRS